MGAAHPQNGPLFSPGRSNRPVDLKDVNVFSIMNLASWSDQALHTVHSTAAIAAALVLLCLGLMYWSGNTLTGRIKARSPVPSANGAPRLAGKDRPNGETAPRPSPQVSSPRIAQLEKELAAARRAEESKTARLAQLEGKLTDTQQSAEAKASRLAQMESELTNVRRLEEARSSQLSQLEGKLTDTQRAEQSKAARLAQLEAELAEARRSDAEKTSRLAELETQMKTARAPVGLGQPETQGSRIESRPGTRLITAAQRTQFLNAVRGHPAGRILISAFFENPETHQFGAELLSLFKDAGFIVMERAPVNFFTTSRPSSGVRLGCRDVNHAPRHYATVRSALEAIGIDAPMTSIVNAEEDDVVEIQITPKQ
jgi:hypothetical protein